MINNSVKKIVLFLYAEAMGYTLATVNSLVEEGLEVYLVHWDNKKLTPFEVNNIPNVHVINRSETSVLDLLSLATNISPDITYISGWQDKDYMKVARFLKNNNKKVVVGFDDQWKGSLKQKLAALLGYFGYFYMYYSHAWVSGPAQFEYARRIGFEKKEIIFDLLSADIDLFHSAFKSSINIKKKKYPHQFLFVGRFEKVKGVDSLLQAWSQIKDHRKDWTLHFVGNGSLKSLIAQADDVLLSDFLQPNSLVKLVDNAGCFVLPSRHEPWGLVIHEFTAAGLPLISSEVVGANTAFLIPGLNGYAFKHNNIEDLANAMLKIIHSSDESLIEFSKESHQLSYRISSKTSARNLLSILD